MATMFLADLGAEVVTVTAPGRPDLMNGYPPYIDELGVSASVAWLGRNKKNITLNLKKPEAVEAVRKLVKEYDIVVEQFRPGVMKKFGLDYESLKKENPALIYCSITGYGQNGPMAMRVDHDLDYVALSGNMIMMDGKTPPTVNIPNFHLADIAGGGYMSTIAILAAVHYREKTGKGQYVDASMFDGVLPFSCIEGTATLAARQYPKGWKGRHVSGTMNGPHYDVYETADHKFMCVGCLEPKFYANMCAAMGLDEWADQRTMFKDRETFRQVLKDKFLEKTREEWCAVFDGVDACVEPVLDITEMVENEQVLARNMVPQVPFSLDPSKSIQQIGNPVKLSESPVEYRHTAYPMGYHTEEILSAFGYSGEEIDSISQN